MEITGIGALMTMKEHYDEGEVGRAVETGVRETIVGDAVLDGVEAFSEYTDTYEGYFEQKHRAIE